MVFYGHGIVAARWLLHATR